MRIGGGSASSALSFGSFYVTIGNVIDGFYVRKGMQISVSVGTNAIAEFYPFVASN